MNTPPTPLIDEPAHIRNRTRAAKTYGGYDFLKKTIAEDIVVRLDAIKRHFPCTLDIGCHNGVLAQHLQAHPNIGTVIASDPAPALVRLAHQSGVMSIASAYHHLPFADDSIDAVFSSLALHWCNDLPLTLHRLARLLKPDGVLMVAVFGGETLSGFRACLAEAETRVLGGMAPRIMPMGDIRSLGGLLQTAGLALPVADSQQLPVSWESTWALMRDLRGMGEGNALMGRVRHFTPRAVFTEAARLMEENHATADGRIEAVFEVITLTAWKPDKSQQQPQRRGSATASLADALG